MYRTLRFTISVAVFAFACAPAIADAPAGSTERYSRVVVHGASLEGNLAGDSPDRNVSVYLPPSYARQPKRRYPVLYLLHGFTDSDARWFGLQGQHFVNVPKAVDAAYAAGVREMIVVMPDAFTKFQGSMYSNSALNGDWETFISRDLVAYVDGHYRTVAKPEGRGLGGHSMGGYGTLRVAHESAGRVFRAVCDESLLPGGKNAAGRADAGARRRHQDGRRNRRRGFLHQGDAGVGRGLVTGSEEPAAVPETAYRGQ